VGDGPGPHQAARDPVGEILIVRREPRVVFRAVENQMNYAYLGDRLKNSAMENFPIFLAEICARSDQAYRTTSTQAMLEDGDPRDYEFPTSQSLLEFAAHRLLWSWYRRDRDALGEGEGDDSADSDAGADPPREE